MHKINTSAIISAARTFGALEAFIQYSKQDPSHKIDKLAQQKIVNKLNTLIDDIEKLEFPLTKTSINKMIKYIEKENGVTLEKLKIESYVIGGRLADEFDAVPVYGFSSNKLAFLTGENTFSEKVEKSFPSAAYEIEEFSKCYALERSTAAVFHLMRIMEIAIRATAKSLGIPDPIKGSDKNWGAILKNIKNEIDLRNNSKKWNSADREIFQQLYTSIDSVRMTWRNTTMHIENKYTTHEAEHIYITVSSFMHTLADRMDETGSPLA